MLKQIKDCIFLAMDERPADDQMIGELATDSLELLHVISELEGEFEVTLPTVDMTPLQIQTEILKQRPELG